MRQITKPVISEDPAFNPDPAVEQTTSLDAGNFNTLLIASLDMLRSDYYTRDSVPLNLAAQVWEPDFAVTVSAPANDTVTYRLTDLAGQPTTIEREWIAPAACQPDERFNYDSC